MVNALNSSTSFIIIVTALILTGASLISIYFGKKMKSSDDWTVGGRKLPFYVVIGSQYATVIGGGVLVAQVGVGYQSGWATITYGVFVGLGLLLLSFMAKWLRENEFTTIPEMLEKVYGKNKVMVAIAALMAIIVPMAAISTQLVAFGKLFADITGLSMNLLIIAFAFICLIFVIPAGLTSVAWTDFVFGIFMILMSFAVAIFALNLAGGWSTVIHTVPSEIWTFPDSMIGVGYSTIALWAFSLVAGTLTTQAYYQRIFAIDNASKAKSSIMLSIVVMASAVLYAGFMGILIRSMNPTLEPEMAAGWFFTKLPLGIMAIYGAFLVVTIMSTVNSFVQSTVVNLTRDFYKGIINSEADDATLLKLSRFLSVIVVMICLLFALVWPEALGWLIMGYSYSAAALLFPIFLGYFLKDHQFLTPHGAIAGMLGGIAGNALAQLAATNIPYAVYGLICSLILLLAVSWLTRK